MIGKQNTFEANTVLCFPCSLLSYGTFQWKLIDSTGSDNRRDAPLHGVFSKAMGSREPGVATLCWTDFGAIVTDLEMGENSHAAAETSAQCLP